MNPQASLHLSLSFFLFLFIFLEGKQSLSVVMFDQRFNSIILCSIILVFLDIKIGYYPHSHYFSVGSTRGPILDDRAQPDSRGRSSGRIRRKDLLRSTWDVGSPDLGTFRAQLHSP